MKTLVEYINESKNSPAKDFLKLFKKLGRFGTSGATSDEITEKQEKAFNDIIKFLKKYEIRRIEAKEPSLKNLYFFLKLNGDKKSLYISVIEDLENVKFSSAELFVGKSIWISQHDESTGELFKYNVYMIPNSFENNEDGRRFVSLIARNLTGDIEDENLLK